MKQKYYNLRMSFALWPVVCGALLAGGAAASAKTWTVDDDRAQFPAANFTNIMAAVNAASNGDTIKVYPGAYHEGVTIAKSLKLIGAQKGKDARTRVTTLAQESVIYAGDVHFSLVADDIVLDGFWVVVDLHDQDEGVGIKCFTSHSGYQILNNIMDAGPTTALVPGNGGQKTMLVRRNLFVGRLGIALDSELAAGAHNVNITENLFEAASLFLGDNAFSDLRITKNKWQQGSIELRNFIQTSVAPNFSIVFSDNKMYDTVGSSLALREVADMLVENNIFRNGTGAGVTINESNSNLLIRNNRISEYEDAGVVIGGTLRLYYPLVEGATLAGNEITGNGDGVRAYFAQNNSILDNKISDNQSLGVYLAADTANNVIDGNELRGNDLWDARDESAGAGTAGTANTWTDNQGTRSSPAGLCED